MEHKKMNKTIFLLCSVLGNIDQLKFKFDLSFFCIFYPL